MKKTSPNSINIPSKGRANGSSSTAGFEAPRCLATLGAKGLKVNNTEVAHPQQGGTFFISKYGHQRFDGTYKPHVLDRWGSICSPTDWGASAIYSHCNRYGLQEGTF